MKKIILGMAACAALCACTSDDALVDNPVSGLVEDGVYMKFNISLADVTRSATDTDTGADYGTSTSGQEYGQTEENTVGKVSIVLTDESGNTVYAKADLSDLDKVGTDTYVVCFEDTDIKEAAGQAVNVFVYCNQTVNAYSKDAKYTLASKDDTTPWTADAFFMSNAVAHQVVLPDEATLSAYSSKANPLDLGVVRVERSVARFDYKDGADTAVPGGAAFTYPLWYDETNGLLASVVLEEAAVINMSNSFYTLRHMANSDTSGQAADLENVTLLSTEYVNNWVIDTDAATKMNGTSTGFVYGMESPSTWEWATLSELTTNDDNDTWSTGTEQNYKIWRYVTENTIPSIAGQTHGNTTGIVFKAELVDVSSGNMFDGVSRVYVYEQVAYANWAEVEAAAEEAGESSSLHDAYREVMDVWNDKTAGTTEYDEDVTAAMSKAGFTGFSPDAEGKYYMYYYYWNRHNDNLDPNNMGIMEYAVVRNNVYKLSVSDITGFGHAKPNDPDDPNPTPDPDPDPVNPDDPDETEEIWIKLDVEILPWVVRVNDITF